MDDRIVELFFSAVAGAIGAAVTYWFWVRQQIMEIRRDYDRELRSARMAAYAKLWQEFEPLAVYAPTESITYDRVRELGVALRSWYFDTGGLLFTRRARDAYFLVQDAIDQIARLPHNDAILRGVSTHWTRTTINATHERLHIRELPPAGATDQEHVAWRDELSALIANEWSFGERPDDDFALLQFLASSLRTLLAEDLLTRDPSLLRREGAFARFRRAQGPSGSAPPPASPARP
jgi:hypothetical protein